MSIIIFLVILALIVLIHEFGHFIVAKKSGIRVDEFGLGFPPRIFGKKFGETIYSLNWIPFGGFVKIFGETPDEESIKGKDSKRSLIHKNRGIQAAVMAAGVAFNLISAWIFISLGFMIGLPTPEGVIPNAEVQNPKLVITSVLAEGPAFGSDFKTGDNIVQITNYLGESIFQPDSEEAQQFIRESQGEGLEFDVVRGKEIVELNVIPEAGIVDDYYAIGISMDMVGTVQLAPHRALYEGFITTVALTKAVTISIYEFVVDAFVGEAKLSQVSGPVGIVGLVGDATTLGFIYLLSFTAFISINLAIINLIPFPALDGGRLLFLLIESITRRPINPKVANSLNAVGFVLLILLMLVVTYSDILKLF